MTTVTTTGLEGSSETVESDDNNSKESAKSGAENERDDSFIVTVSENIRPGTNAEDQQKSAEDLHSGHIDRTGAGGQEGESDDLFFIATRAKDISEGKVEITHPTILLENSDEDENGETIKSGIINLDGSGEKSGHFNKYGSTFEKVKNVFGSTSSESPKADDTNSSERTEDDVLAKAAAGALNIFGKIKSDVGSAAEEVKSSEHDEGHSNLVTMNPPEIKIDTTNFSAPGIFIITDEDEEEARGLFGTVKGGLGAAVDNAKSLFDDSKDKLSEDGEDHIGGIISGVSSSFEKIKDDLGAGLEKMESGLKSGVDKIKDHRDELEGEISGRDHFAIDVTIPSVTLGSQESSDIKHGITDTVASAFDSAKTLFGSSSNNNQASTESSNENDGLLGKVSSGATNVFGKIKGTFGGEGEIEVAPVSSEDIAGISIVKKIPGADSDAAHTVSFTTEDSIESMNIGGILDKTSGGISSAFDGVKNSFDGITEKSHIDNPEIDLSVDNSDVLERIAEETTSIFRKVKGDFQSSGEDENNSSEKSDATEKSITHGLFDLQGKSVTEKTSKESGEKQGLLDKVGVEIGSAFGKVKGIFGDSSESSKEDGKNGVISTGFGSRFGTNKFAIPSAEISTLPPTPTLGGISVTLPENLSPTPEEDGLLEKVSGGVGKIKGVFGGSADSSKEEKDDDSWTSGISNAFGNAAKSAETSITDLKIGVTAPAISAENSTPAPGAESNSGENNGWFGKVKGGIGSALGGAISIIDDSSEGAKIDISKESEKSDGILGGIASGTTDLFGKIKDTFPSSSNSKEIKIELGGTSDGLIPSPTLPPSGPGISLFDAHEHESGVDKISGAFDAASGHKINAFDHTPDLMTIGGGQDISQESQDFLEAVAKETSTMFGKVKNIFDSDSTTATPTINAELNKFKIDGEITEEKGAIDSVLGGFGSAFDRAKTVFESSTENPHLATDSEETKNDGDDKSLLGGMAAGASSAFGKIQGAFSGETAVTQSGEEGAHTKIKQLGGEISIPEMTSEEEEIFLSRFDDAFDRTQTGLGDIVEKKPTDTSNVGEGQDILSAVGKETSSVFGKVKNTFDDDTTTEKSASEGIH